jgi:hypothetical protein
MVKFYFLAAKSLMSIERTVEAIERTIAPSIAGSQPSTIKPGTNREVNLKTMALIIKTNSPRVMTVKGKVSKSKIGLMNVFITPRTIAAKSAEVNESTLNPGTI